MTLVIDNRAQLQGQPGLHVFIAGVSHYPHLPQRREDADTPYSFGMRQLSSTSLAAYHIYYWLLKRQQGLAVPLATCRLLLSPSIVEINVNPAIQELRCDRCTLDNFLQAAKDWRQDAGTHKDNMTLFYFAGHGVQRSKDDAVLLLEEFGKGVGGPLLYAVDINNIFNGMASSSSYPDMAQRQVYFVDACRNLPAQFRNFETLSTSQVFEVELGGRDDRCAPIFYAAVPDSAAQGLVGKTTLFNQALIESLDGVAAVPGEEKDESGQAKWYVSGNSLGEALESYFKFYRQKHKIDQDFTVGGSIKTIILHHLDSPPPVNVSIRVEPIDGHPHTHVTVRNSWGKIVWNLNPPLTPHPYEGQLPAGIYSIIGTIKPPCPLYENFKSAYDLVKPKVHPSRFEWRVEVKK